MVLRRCSICDRNFTKAEHYHRHQRSHTKERPYECVTCKKRFSRSDVLFRHSKLHSQQISDDQVDPSNSSVGALRASPSNGPTVSAQEERTELHAPLNVPDRPSYFQERSFLDNQMAHSRHMSMPDISHGHPPYVGSSQQHGFLPRSTPAHTYMTPVQEFPQDVSTPAFAVSSYDPQLVSINHPQLENMLPGALAPIAMNSPGQSQDLLQFWLSDLEYGSLALPNVGNTPNYSNHCDGLAQSSLSRCETNEISETSSTGNIPNERFTRVERCWLAKSNNTYHFAQDLWSNVIHSPGSNLFSNGRLTYRGGSDSRWGVNPELRSRLEAEFGTPTSGARKSVLGDSSKRNNTFPPTEVLEICLDHFFRRFHPMAPFIHVPSFDASTTPLPLLYAMCMLGLSVLESSNGAVFISNAFTNLLQKVHNDLASDAVTPSALHQRLAIFAAGFLTLNLAALSGDKDRLAQSQALYATLMVTVQRQGLFTIPELELEMILDDLKDEGTQWLAWARVESVKRLVVALVTTDWWFSANSSVSPGIRPETLQIYLPCDDSLFKAESSRKWVEAQRGGKRLSLPMVKPRTFNLEGALDPVILLNPPLDAPGQFAILSAIKLCVCDAQHRHFLPSDDWDRHDHLIPWETYQDDFHARSLVQTTLALAPLVTGSSRISDLNSVVLWHNICLTLNSNVQIFELAAGRAGAGPAGKALSDVSDWARTASARRACVHAAQTFKLLSNRKVSESVTLNSMSALFCSALILGLYLFTTQPQDNDSASASYELLDDVDWTVIGNAGMAEHSPENSPGRMFESAHASDSARTFIEVGGPVSLNGVSVVGGYQSARRTLLDFAHLMDGIGTWKPRTLARILHIMSDVLEESF